MIACEGGYVEIAECLLDQGCDKDRADNDGWTALHLAAVDGHVEVAQLLFRYGVKLDARDHIGDTPADVAASNGHHALAEAIRIEKRWVDRRMAMFVALKATVAEGAKQPLLARLRENFPEIMKDVVLFL
jgi:hypothetical protein